MEAQRETGIIDQFETRSGEHAIIRSMAAGDVDGLHSFINNLSAEDTFITYSGEEVSKEEEQKYVDDALSSMEKGDSIYAICEINGTVAGNASVTRKSANKKRSEHVGMFDISVAAEYRGQGIGKRLLDAVIDQSKQINGLKMLELEVFGNNHKAIELYKNSGFAETGRLPNGILHKSEYVDLITMTMPLEDGFFE